LIHDIVLSNASLSTVNEFLSELLGGQECASLAYAVYSRTAGNFFFIKEPILNLLDEEHLVFRDGSWNWNAAEIEAQDTSGEDILLFIADKLRQQSSDMQSLLKTAACLGGDFGTDALRYLVKRDEEQRLEQLLRNCQDKGLFLVRKTSSSLTWSFAHDRFQQASYSLIPESDRAAFHLAVGRTLRNFMSTEELEKYMSLVASQFILGANLISRPDERVHTASLCLQAGKKQAALSNFEGASRFFDTSLSLLPEDRWTSNYNLCLELYDASAEVCYVLADFERLDMLTAEVCKQSKNFGDTIQSYTTHVYSLGSRNMLPDAIEEGLLVLEKLGERFPQKVNRVMVLILAWGTRRKLSRLSDRHLLYLPEMTDRRKLAAQRLLNLLFSYMYLSGDKTRATFLTIRSVQLILKYGASSMSSLSLANLASFFCGIGDIERGYRLGQVAASMLERFNARE